MLADFEKRLRYAAENTDLPEEPDMEKVQMSESDKAPKIPVINQYIEEKLVYYKELVESMTDDRKSEWEPLEDVFRKIVNNR